MWRTLTLLLLLTSPALAQTDRLAEVKRDLGEKAAVTSVEGFLIAAPFPGDRTGASAVARQAILAFYNGRFQARPKEPVLVYLFPSSRPYQAFCQARWKEPCVSIYGFFLSAENLIVLDVGPGVGTLTHEIVHPIVRADFPDAPTWLDEGLASLYEGFALGKNRQIHGTRNWRLPRLKQALHKERQAISLPALFALSDQEFRNQDESLHYATARYFCLFLEQKGWLWSFYQGYRDHYSEDPTGTSALVAATGKTQQELDPEWIRWVRSL